MQNLHLAADIITEHFGEIIGKVATVLLYRDHLTLQDIIKFSELQFVQVKNSLLVLIQQNLVNFWEELDEQDRQKLTTFYRVNVQQVIWRLRYPRYLSVAKQRFGDEGALMVQQLLEHGRLTKGQLMEQVAQIAGMEVSDGALLDMIRHHFIVRVPDAPSPQPAPDVSSFQAGPKRGSKLAAEVDEDDDDDMPTVFSRNSRPSSNLSDAFRGKGIKPKSGKKIDYVPAKSVSAEAALEDVNAYWCVNCLRFNVHFKHEACINLISEKIDPTAGAYARTMFRLVEPFLHQGAETSVALAVHDLLPELQKDFEDSEEISLGSLVNYLNMMSTEQVHMVKKISDEPLSFALWIGNMSAFLKQKVVESIVQQRFGDLSLRIFRLLLIKKQLEQKQIADMALIPLNEARERLYKMLSCQFVHLQEVPKTADHAPSRTFYLWSVRMDELFGQVEKELYALLRKMRQRLQAELSSSPDLDRQRPLSDLQLQRVSDRLDNAILQLDNSLMVLVDF